MASNLTVIISFVSLICGGFLSASSIESGPWIGAVTAENAVVKLVPKSGSKKISLLLQEEKNPNQSSKISPSNTLASVVEFSLTNLKPNTAYRYVAEIDGEVEKEKLGRFQTFPDRASSFQFAFASCAETGSRHSIFKTIENAKPLFYLNAGDLHYEDILENNPDRFRETYRKILASASQASLYRNVPFVYSWDDHDYAGNNSHSKSKARSAARQVYQEMVPHYPLVEGKGDIAIYQSFLVGRVKFLLTDSRSERSPASQRDDAAKTMLGKKQKAWFKRELLNSKGKHPLIFWVSSVPWISHTPVVASNAPDFWGSYHTERKEIADFIAENQISGICILSGDGHMLAADDGTNSDFSTVSSPKIPVMQAGPLDRPKSLKGGPYSQGVYLPKQGEGCYGFVKVQDTPSKIHVSFSGRNQLDEEKITLEFTLPFPDK